MNRWKNWVITIMIAALTTACSNGEPLGLARTAEPIAGSEPASLSCEPAANYDPRIHIPDEHDGSTGAAPIGCAEDPQHPDSRIHVQGD